MKKIKIGIVARDLSKVGGGTKSYTLNVLKELDSLLYKNEKFEVHILLNEISYLDKNCFKNIRAHFVKERNILKFDLIETTSWVIRSRFDLVFSFKHFLLPFSTLRLCKTQGIMIYDVGYLDDNNHYGIIDSIKTKLIFNFVKKSSDFFITISNFSKKQIVEKLKIQGKKILVAEPGVNNYIGIEKKDRFGEKYFLVIDNAKRKNTKKIIESFVNISDQISESLYVVGKNSHTTVSLFKKSKKIKSLGFVKGEVLINLYRNATALIFFSSYEGFGIPILEAQSNSCPVICSNIDVFLEVAKNSVIYVNKNSPHDLEKSMLELSDNKKLRKRLINEGLLNCKNFSWKRSSKKILNFIEAFNKNDKS